MANEPLGRAPRSAGTVAAAALLPPLGVALAGRPRREFWIATGLTVLGVLPGAVFALARVRREAERQA